MNVQREISGEHSTANRIQRHGSANAKSCKENTGLLSPPIQQPENAITHLQPTLPFNRNARQNAISQMQQRYGNQFVLRALAQRMPSSPVKYAAQGNRVQRDPAWTPKDPAPPAPPKYAAIPANVVQILQKSFLKHASDGTAIPEGFKWDTANPAGWPTDLWSALDNISPAGISAITENYDLLKSYPDLMAKIGFIKNSWNGTSRGFKFDTNESDLRSWLEKSSNFCKDSFVVGMAEHGGQDCWRELGKDNVPGLHVCLGNGLLPDMHIDMHQVVYGKSALVPSGNCIYDPLSIYEHEKDLKGGGSQTAFTQCAQEVASLKKFRDEISADCPKSANKQHTQEYLDRTDDMLTQLSDDNLRTWASAGFDGEKKAKDALDKVKSMHDTLEKSKYILCRVEYD